MLKHHYYRATAFVAEEHKICHFFHKSPKSLSEEELINIFTPAIIEVCPKFDRIEVQRIPKEMYHEVSSI